MLPPSADTYLTLSERANIANRAQVDLFISFHENSATNKSATGYEDYTSGTTAPAKVAARKAFQQCSCSISTE
ncbi:N-acetylmuramoyl-L-alanine amidase family protein [Lysinibacillus sp. 3P01SB]|uniref:N-acetylmuramoyl-L-alanine amidase family protein n=1 Tax=Lysinibacillus sp. 3P01SB TaxID=3132284 RepID=UPI0039A543AF